MEDRRSSGDGEPPRSVTPLKMLTETLGGLFGVIDLETAPDPLVTTLMRAKAGARINSAAHRIECAAMLVAREQPDGTWTDFRLDTVYMPTADEIGILRAVDRFLLELGREDGVCVTFNGIHHDFGMIRRRAARYWLFECEGLEAIDRTLHIDLMRTITRGWRDEWPSLAAACAGLTIPVNHRLEGPVSHFSDRERKAQTDCVSTFLLLLFELAIRRRSIRTLGEGWTGLAKFLSDRWHLEPHLMQFTRHAFLEGWTRPGREAAWVLAPSYCFVPAEVMLS